jgi:nicotinamidase-related amidase
MDYSFLPEIDQKVISMSGYGERRGFGKKPALIIIDAQNKYIGPDLPILEAIKMYPLSIGERAHRACENLESVLQAARVNHIPILYSVHTVPVEETRFNSFAKKRITHELNNTIPADSEDIFTALKPKPGEEWVIHKRYASAMFGTPMASFLNALGCDTVIVAGFSTCGCVRAFSLDATSLNYNVTVIEDCVADRIEMSHKMALVDLSMKYADVAPSAEIISYFEQLT